jgi:hypothetical protein
MKIISSSHLDHGLHESVVAHIAERFAARDSFFIETFELPAELPSARSGLHGPLVGDAPISECDVWYELRGARSGPSRLCARPLRVTRLVTVVAGPHEDEPCVLYTAYGGPQAPREPWDRSLTPDQAVESEEFWSTHALSRVP